MSSPFFGKNFLFKQPDGKALPVTGYGDQFEAVFETADGHTVVEDPTTGFFEYAIRKDGYLKPSGITPGDADPAILGIEPHLRNNPAVIPALVRRAPGLTPGKPRWKIRREETKNALQQSLRFMEAPAPALAPGAPPAPPGHQTVGNYIGLCLLIRFPDVPGTIAQAEIEDFCNKDGYTGFGNNGSVYNYFDDVSGGKLNYTNVVTPYYTAKNPKAYYTNEAVDDGVMAKELILEALDFWKTQNFDFGQLSVDGENCVYAINAFYAGAVDNRWAKGLWPHSDSLDDKHDLGQGKFAHDFQITNIGSDLSLGTFCHENGHMICSFPDLYSYGSMPKGDGVYCLMCLGGVQNEKNPVKICAYLRNEAGWASSVTTLTPGLQATVTADRNDFFVHRKDRVEYFILENREKKGRDAGLTDSGLAIWHIDELGDNTGQTAPNGPYECALVQADGRKDLENGTNIGDATDLFSQGTNSQFGKDTQPASNWLDGSPSGLEITGIGREGTTMTFSVIN